MADAATRKPDNTRSSLIILAVLAVGFLFRFLPLLFWHSIAQADEIFQAVEQGHRLAYGYWPISRPARCGFPISSAAVRRSTFR